MDDGAEIGNSGSGCENKYTSYDKIIGGEEWKKLVTPAGSFKSLTLHRDRINQVALCPSSALSEDLAVLGFIGVGFIEVAITCGMH